MMRYVMSLVGGMFLSMLIVPQTCEAADDTIYKVEEFWEMVINEPDPANLSPQVSFYTSPSVNIDDCYFELQLNHAADEGFSGGGLRVASIDRGEVIEQARSDMQHALAVDGDRIRWTSVMAVSGRKLLFAIKDGMGQEWGAFGGPDFLVTIPGGPVADLSEYHPQNSLDSVDIGFGANRVTSVTLLAVRVYYADGRTITVPVNRQP